MIRRGQIIVALFVISVVLRADHAKADPPLAAPATAASGTASSETAAPTAPAVEAKLIAAPVETAATAPTGSVATAEWLEKIYAGRQPPEAVLALIAIARGSKSGPGKSWFGPAQTRYDWDWLAGLHGLSSSEVIPAEAFRGKPEWFARLDRNKDGRIVANDLDWSESSPYVQMSAIVNRVFRTLDADGDSNLTRAEQAAFFEAVSMGKDHVTAGDLRDALLAGVSSPDDLRDTLLTGNGNSFRPGDAPTPELMVRGLFSGETGCINEGPKLGDPAPDFTLKTHDGKQAIRLSDLRGSKPVVLVFGNFTCRPFRNSYPLVDELCQRYQNDAIFLSVYVREARPSDGWAMLQNTEVGIHVAQPRTFDERMAVAQTCHAKLNYSMPLLVDEINDPVGNTYSGMPSRLYVIDSRGIVAYKNGRGPFGFKPAEMEKALVMCLLEHYAAATPVAAAAEATANQAHRVARQIPGPTLFIHLSNQLKESTWRKMK